jgi:DNA-binding FadR family transcriptional regulator
VIADTVFAPVQSRTAFEETLERLGTAIKLGLLPPGTRLPPERDLCEQLGIARSTLRQALTALVQSGYLHAVRGRGGGTFVAERPLAGPPSIEVLADWRDRCDVRMAIEVGVAVLAAERADAEAIERLDALVAEMAAGLERFAVYRRADVLFHIALAEATGSAALVTAVTESQGAMTDLISYIAHPPEVLAWANAQHARLVDCLEHRDPAGAMQIMADHLRGTEHVLAGLLP